MKAVLCNRFISFTKPIGCLLALIFAKTQARWVCSSRLDTAPSPARTLKCRALNGPGLMEARFGMGHALRESQPETGPLLGVETKVCPLRHIKLFCQLCFLGTAP